ncbi:SAM-dependent methyltransferase [uncultured Desulfosarcina sp.]|uniref:SAM-dependent methyltransferase n=1 Tax=uncultured Desulfosarcina sp. TaxID=218289 RepID=UPI0029C6F2E9|nr:SAM-dependent methyltransferase [uncultured Desulfosarcina sp.]
MQPDHASITAENNALLRTHESLRPEKERICNDTYAAWFLADRLMDAVDRNQQIRQTVETWENRFPGIVNSILARTRFIDDCLEAAIGEGIRQLVILGAGYDTRVLRFGALRDKVAVFELDHPETQRIKLQRIQEQVGADLPHVRFISIDFSKDPLGEALFAHGYDAQLKTIFIWEGVTYYLPGAVIDGTLGFIRRYAGRGSSVVFDYFPPSVAAGTTDLVEARALRDGLQTIGEAIVFGIAPDRIPDFLSQRGFRVTAHLTSTDYHARYFLDVNRSRRVSEMFILVQARVDDSIDQHQQ